MSPSVLSAIGPNRYVLALNCNVYINTLRVEKSPSYSSVNEIFSKTIGMSLFSPIDLIRSTVILNDG